MVGRQTSKWACSEAGPKDFRQARRGIARNWIRFRLAHLSGNVFCGEFLLCLRARVSVSTCRPGRRLGELAAVYFRSYREQNGGFDVSTISLPITPSSVFRTHPARPRRRIHLFVFTPRLRATISFSLSSSKGSTCSLMYSMIHK
jgi:hypothetical protein